MTYPYRLKPWIVWFSLAITVLALTLQTVTVITGGTQALLATKGGGTLSPFWIVFFGLGFAGWLVYLGLLIAVELRGGQRVTITDTHIVVPAQYWSSKYVTIDYQTVTRIKVVANRSRIQISGPAGERGVVGNYLPPGVYDYLLQMLTHHCVNAEVVRVWTTGR